MPARIFQHGVPPQRLRTFLILFALALTVPLLGIATFALNRMASLEQAPPSAASCKLPKISPMTSTAS
jgi:hypothetical protein